ncbi:hypothetical protein PAPHI01_2501 [Pancytospora philotis]|nr:hypothetical protein PAPHI01_2501 [Pancytospora philotis]
MACISEVRADSNPRDIKNVLADDDACWFSSAVDRAVISMVLDTSATVLYVEFQKGFQPSRITVLPLRNTTELRKEACEATVDVSGHSGAIELLLEKSYDPYGRFCIYNIRAE